MEKNVMLHVFHAKLGKANSNNTRQQFLPQRTVLTELLVSPATTFHQHETPPTPPQLMGTRCTDML